MGNIRTHSNVAEVQLNTKAEGGAYPPAWLSWSIWGIAALFYFAGFYQRVSPAVMTDELMRAFGIGAASLGNLSAFYLYFYVAMQIPTGILVDSWGARKLLIAGSVAAALGAVIFASTNSFVESVPAQFLGTISGTTNIGNMLGPALLQPGIGWILDKRWSGMVMNGVHVYNLHAYRMGFLLMIGWLLMSSLLLSFTTETYCKQSV